MRIQTVKWKRNGTGDLSTTVRVVSDDQDELLYENVVNLSREKERNQLIRDILALPDVTAPESQIRTRVMSLLRDGREQHLSEMETEDGRVREPSRTEQLARRFLDQGPVLFHDQFDSPYMALEENGRQAIYRLDSKVAARKLAHTEYRQTGTIPTRDSLDSAIRLLQGQAVYDGPLHPLHVRTAWYDQAIYYDLGDWTAVRIDYRGWTIEERPPILFRRFPHQEPQVQPVHGGSVDDLLQLINLPDSSDRLLFTADLVAGLVPGISRAVSVFHGPQGSAKSTAMKIKRQLMDPSVVPVMGMPKDETTFAQWGSHNLCVFLDNLSYMPRWLADALSRLCTGDGLIKRQLFTDDDDFVSTSQGVGGVTGVNLVVTQPDLLDRSILYKFERPADAERLEDSEIWNKFEAMRPAVLGAMFDVLAYAIASRDHIDPPRLARLADHSRWMCAAAMSMGYKQDEFREALNRNTSSQHAEAIEASSVASVLLSFMEGREVWIGTASELLDELCGVAETMKVSTRTKAWPKAPNHVTRAINNVKPNLEAEGLLYHNDDKRRPRRILLEWMERPDEAEAEDIPQ